MKLSDYEEVLRLWQDSEGVGLNESDTRPAIAAYLKRNRGMSYVARDGKLLVGAVLCGHDGRRGKWRIFFANSPARFPIFRPPSKWSTRLIPERRWNPCSDFSMHTEWTSPVRRWDISCLRASPVESNLFPLCGLYLPREGRNGTLIAIKVREICVIFLILARTCTAVPGQNYCLNGLTHPERE